MHWICDTCGGTIRRAEDAYLTASGDLDWWGIVHARSSCDNHRDGPWHPLGDFHKPGPFARAFFGTSQGTKLWRMMVRDGAFSSLTPEAIEALRQRVYAGDGGDTAPPERLPANAEDRGLTLRFRIFKRDGYRCQICGRTAQDGVTLEVDHKHPRARGGSNDPSNLWTLCFECNRGKRAEEL